MDYVLHSFRHSEVILNEPEHIELYSEIISVISGISDEDLIEKHNSYGIESIEKTPKSLSRAINVLL